MSVNQSKSEKNESQFRKSGGGRSGGSNQQRSYTGGSGKGGGGGTTAPPLSAHPPSLSGNRSFKKTNNAQSGQQRVTTTAVLSTPKNNAAHSTVQNGAHSQSAVHVRDAPVPAPSTTAKPADPANQRTTKPIPKAPSQSPPLTSDVTAPSNPAKGDGGRGIALQFGSISPGFMNGMQVPPRTTSAPPNLDEQNRDQARREVLRAAPAIPIPSAPKPQVPKKDVSHPTVQPSAGERHPELRPRREGTHVPPATVTAAAPAVQQKPTVLPMGGGIHVPMHFSHPSPVSMQFGGPSPQIQSQGIPSSSPPMPMQMQLPIGNASQVQQQVFMPGFQHHIMQPQGLIHQGQSLGFSPPMGPQMPHLGGLGMNLPPQFSSPQPMKYSSGRKTVKITHPDTHEELRLDKKTDAYTENSGLTVSRPLSNVSSQLHSVPSYNPPHSVNYYSSSYTAGPPVFPSTSSSAVPLTSAQLTGPTQASRFNYSVNQPHSVPHIKQSAPSAVTVNPSHKDGVSHGSTITSNANPPRAVPNTSQITSGQVTIRPIISSGDSKAVGLSKVSGPPELISQEPNKDLNLSGENQSHSSALHSELSVTSPSVVHSAPMEMSSSSSSAASSEPSSTATKANSSRGTINMEDGQLIQQVSSDASSVLYQSGDSADLGALKSDETKNDISASSEVPSKPLNCVNTMELGGIDVDGVVESSSSVSSELVTGDYRGSVGDRSAVVQDKEPFKQEEQNAKDESKQQNIGLGEVDSSSCVNDADRRDQDVDLKTRSIETDTSESRNSVVDTAISHVGSLASNLCTVSDAGNVAMSKESDSMVANVTSSSSLFGKVVNESLKQEGEGTELSRPASSSGSRPSSSSGSRPSSSSGARPTSSSGARPTSSSGARPTSSSGVRPASSSESNRSKSSLVKGGKKKKKEIFQKADAQGATSDLYTAYKGPEEKKETPLMAESKILSSDLKPVSKGDSSTGEKDDRGKVEPDDWEDAAEISTPKLQSSGDAGLGLTADLGDDSAVARKYSRDFLLTFSEQCTDLPVGFGLPSDNADILCSNVGSSREFSSPGRVLDRTPGPRNERRANTMMDVIDKWGKHPGAFPPGPDPGYGGNVAGFRPQGSHSGVLRNHPRAQQNVQFPLLSGPAQSVTRINSDGDRWRSVSSKGLIPPPQAPVMHRAEKRYEVGKVTDEEEAKQRRLKGILNKLTPQNFEKLFIQVKEVNIDNAVTLTGVISQIFDKALMEPTFCEMYADFCSHLASDLPELTIDGQKITFKRLLLNKCQEEFERGEREEAEANKDDSTDEPNQSKQAREEMRLQVRRRMLGNIRLIGELYKKKMLTERIMHECIKKLMGSDYQNPDEENIEALCKLLSTIGKMIDHSKAKEFMDAYFRMMTELSNNMNLSSRVRFMLKDVIDLRRNRWEQRRKVEGPKKIDEVRRDAVQERQAQSSRLSRGPSMNSSIRRNQPVDYGAQGSMMSSPVGHMGSFRGLPSQPRNFVMQDGRTDDRGSFENRISLTLPQRPLNDEAITLGPQGGLARRMSVRPSVSTLPLADMSQSQGESRGTNGMNSFSSGPERPQYNSRDSNQTRYNPARFGGSSAHDQPNIHVDSVTTDHSLDRHTTGPLPVKEQELPSTHNASSEKAWPEDRLRDKSLAAIREYYSAKDEKEVTWCVRDLKAPGFYPSVISTWVTDSFERKDLERDLLAKLIINLSNPKEGLFVPDQLIKGFESVLSSLEDTVTDAPRAPEFLGRLFAKVITEDILSLSEVGRLLYEGGEEPGGLKEAGLAGDVLGFVLETVKSERGQSAVEEIRAKSKLRLEDFRPPEPLKSRKLELFI